MDPALSHELEVWQRPQANNHRALISYAALLRKIVQTFLAHGFNADFSATYLLKIARDKLPNSRKMKWSEHTIDNNIQNAGILEWKDRHSRACEQLEETSPQNNNGFQTNIRRNNPMVSNSSHRNQFSTNGTPTINIDPMIEEITKNHFTQAITSENKTVTINNLVFQGIKT